MFKFINTFILVTVLLFNLSCGKNEKVKAKDNFEVYNIKSKQKKSINNEYYTNYISYCNDTIRIFNNISNKIELYDEKGKLISAFGNIGKGPGEFENLTCLFFDKDGIFAYDADNRKIIWYDKKGGFRKEIKIKYGGLKFYKKDSLVYIPTIGIHDYYIYVVHLYKNQEHGKLFKRTVNPLSLLKPEQILLDSYLISVEQQYLSFIKLNEDILGIANSEGKIIARGTRGWKDIEIPRTKKKTSHEIIIDSPINISLKSKDSKIYLLSKHPVEKTYAIYRFSLKGELEAKYQLDEMIRDFEIVNENKFLILNQAGEVLLMTFI